LKLFGKNDIINHDIKEDGGPGSGNWGHKGRPGSIGGSSGSGESSSTKGTSAASQGYDNPEAVDKARADLSETLPKVEGAKDLARVVESAIDYMPIMGDVDVSANVNGLDISGIVDKKDNDKNFQFSISNQGDGKIEIDLLTIPENMRGKTTTQFVNKVLEGAKANGFKKVSLYAARSNYLNGYYSWARFGFDATLSKEFTNKSEFSNLKNASGKRPKTVQDLMSTKEGRDWWKKNGDSLDMEYKL